MKIQTYIHQGHVGNQRLDFLDDFSLGCCVELDQVNCKYRLLLWFLLGMMHGQSIRGILAYILLTSTAGASSEAATAAGAAAVGIAISCIFNRVYQREIRYRVIDVQEGMNTMLYLQ